MHHHSYIMKNALAIILPFVVVTAAVFCLSQNDYMEYNSISNTIMIASTIGAVVTAAYLCGLLLGGQMKTATTNAARVDLSLT